MNEELADWPLWLFHIKSAQDLYSIDSWMERYITNPTHDIMYIVQYRNGDEVFRETYDYEMVWSKVRAYILPLVNMGVTTVVTIVAGIPLEPSIDAGLYDGVTDG